MIPLDVLQVGLVKVGCGGGAEIALDGGVERNLGNFCCYGLTRNSLLLVSVPVGVVTVTKPVVAPAGTVAVR